MSKRKLCKNLLLQVSKLCTAVAERNFRLVQKYANALNHSILNDELQIIVHDLYMETVAHNWRTAKTDALVLVNETTQRTREHYGLLVTKEQKANYQKVLRNRRNNEHFFNTCLK